MREVFYSRHWPVVRIVAILLAAVALLTGPPSSQGALATAKASVALATVQRDVAHTASRSHDRLSCALRDDCPAPLAPLAVPPKAPPPPKPAAPTKAKKATEPPVAIPASCNGFSGNKAIACALLPQWGFGINQMACLVPMWNKESGWNERARNPSSGAYGIPQSLPASKMAASGADYLTSPATQIKWGLSYIRSRYRTPCGAWVFWQAHSWY